MNERKKFALGILLGLVVLTLVAFVPSLTDFNSGQFNTDNRTVTIGAAVPLTNASLRSSAAYQKDTNSLAFSVSVYNISTITNVEEWRSIPYPAGSPNVLGNVDLNGNLFMSGNGNFGSGAAAGTPSAIRLIDSTTGKYWQWSELNAASNIIERLPTNGNNGLSWGIKMWTNAAIATDGTPTNQAMNFQLGTGLSVDWANRQITASGVITETKYAVITYTPGNTLPMFACGEGVNTAQSSLTPGMLIQHNCVVTNLAGGLTMADSSIGGGTNVVITLYTNSTTSYTTNLTPLTITLSAGTPYSSDTTHGFSIVATPSVPVLLTIGFTNTAGGWAAKHFQTSFELIRQ